MACSNSRNLHRNALRATDIFSVLQADTVPRLKSRPGMALRDITNGNATRTSSESSKLKLSLKCVERNPLVFTPKCGGSSENTFRESGNGVKEKKTSARRCGREISEHDELEYVLWKTFKTDRKPIQALQENDGTRKNRPSELSYTTEKNDEIKLCSINEYKNERKATFPDAKQSPVCEMTKREMHIENGTTCKHFVNYQELSAPNTSDYEDISVRLIQLRCKRLSLRQKDLCFKRQNISLKQKRISLIQKQEEVQKLAKQMLISPISP